MAQIDEHNQYEYFEIMNSYIKVLIAYLHPSRKKGIV